jgi:uncharacterized protein (DUF1330 family)
MTVVLKHNEVARMAVYALAQLTIRDRDTYNRYTARFLDVLAAFGGRLLAADGSPRVVEGGWDREKVVLIEFPDAVTFEAWATSPEYVAIAADRLASTTGNVLLVRGSSPRAVVPPGEPLVCEECGFDYATQDPMMVGDAAVELAAAMAGVLTGTKDVRARREPAVWSPLEYGCHLRDVFIVQRERVLLALRSERPEVVSMGRDERVEHDGYSSQEPGDVARQLIDAASMFTNVVGRLASADLGRTLIYGYPDRAERPIAWVAVHTLHEAHHHLQDVQRQLA